MKRTTVTLCLALCLLLFPSPSWSKQRAKAPRTVLDYFLLLPRNRYFERAMHTPAQRLQWLRGTRPHSVVDIANDYIFSIGDGAQPPLTVALFRFRGRVTVAVLAEWEDGRLDFLRFERGEWRNVTRQVLPIAYSAKHFYAIPRRGTTIQVLSGRDWTAERKPPRRHLYDLVWKNGRFEKR